MPDEAMKAAASAAGRQLLFELASCVKPCPKLAMRIEFIVMEALELVDEHRRKFSLSFDCPKCLRHYRVNVSLRGRVVNCVGCGYRWRSPETLSRN
jgi:hypothetical protein